MRAVHEGRTTAERWARNGPRQRYRVTAMARVLIGLRRWLPDRAFDAFLGAWFR